MEPTAQQPRSIERISPSQRSRSTRRHWPVAASMAAILAAACGGDPGSSTEKTLQAEPDLFASGAPRDPGSTGAEGQGGADGSQGKGAGQQEPESPAELVKFYEQNSLLAQAEQYSLDVVGDDEQWNGPYMFPEPENATRAAGEFLTIYPRAFLAAPDQSVLSTLADRELWQSLSEIGITLMHPVAVEQAGQVYGRELRPSIDGGFDRISMNIEPDFGDADDVRELVRVAREFGANVAGDIIPLHTGFGYDFRLAEMNYQDYPGVYDMIEVPQENWDLLPPVEDQWGFEIITKDDAQPLIDLGIIPGQFDVLLGKEESTNWSGWAATGQVEGVDGQTRRWVYAHLFKPEQPSVNWMDPTYAGRRTQSGDIVRHVVDLGMQINRLDAVPFIGLEPLPDSDGIDVFTTPLAIMGTNELAFAHRKLGGWTWVELNAPTGEYNRYMENGPDIGYDFFTRAQTVHPLINGDARILRVAQRSLIQGGVDSSRLIHALQNHDEIAYQLINLRTQDQVEYGGETIGGTELADRILEQMQTSVAGDAAPYNALYRPARNGVATTFAAFIAPALGIDPYQASAEEVATIVQAHALLAHVNAMQPGVFALSQWDLIGALPLDRSQVSDRISEGDYRWLNRGAVDLMGVSSADQTAFGLPEAQHLYRPLPEQLDDPDSFASRVARIISARKDYRISDAQLVAVPDLEDQGTIALIMSLAPEVGGVGVTLANYGREASEVSVDLSDAMSGSGGLSGTPTAIVTGEQVGSLSGTTLTVPLDGLSAQTVVIGATPLSQGGTGEGGSSSGSGGSGSGGSGGAGATGSGATGSGATGAGATGSGAAGGSGGASGI